MAYKAAQNVSFNTHSTTNHQTTTEEDGPQAQEATTCELQGIRLSCQGHRVKVDDGAKLYPVEILQTEGDRVKVHYAGYSSVHDEWKKTNELEVLQATSRPAAVNYMYKPFNHHNLLGYEIKLALKGSRKDPCIAVEVPFDLLIYNGGLKQLGTFKGTRAGHEVYEVKKNEDLTPLLGQKWYI